MRRILTVLNPSAKDFEAEKRWPSIESRLSEKGSVHVLRTSIDAEKTKAELRERIEEGVDRVLAIGGDGTVHLVINTLMSSRRRPLPELAVIPFGTANDVAKSLGLPLTDLEAMADIAAGDHLSKLDVAGVELRDSGKTVRSCFFVDSVTIGMDADVVSARQSYRRQLKGYLSYLAALAERSVVQQSFDVHLVIDEQTIDTRAFNIIINNVPIYAGELRMPGSFADDEKLDVYLFNRIEYGSKLLSFAIRQADILNIGVDELLDELVQNQREFHGREVRLRMAFAQSVQVDGEAFGRGNELLIGIAGQLDVASGKKS